jgi:hypothetical protein
LQKLVEFSLKKRVANFFVRKKATRQKEKRPAPPAQLAFTFRDQRSKPILRKQDCFFVARCSTLQLHMAAIRHPVHPENDFRRAIEVIGVLQDEKVRAKLGDPKLGAITYDVHFHLC